MGGKLREAPLFLEWGQAKGIGKVHYFWDREVLLFTERGGGSVKLILTSFYRSLD